jgi:hypothetical protein
MHEPELTFDMAAPFFASSEYVAVLGRVLEKLVHLFAVVAFAIVSKGREGEIRRRRPGLNDVPQVCGPDLCCQAANVAVRFGVCLRIRQDISQMTGEWQKLVPEEGRRSLGHGQ